MQGDTGGPRILHRSRGGANATTVRDRRPGAGPPYDQRFKELIGVTQKLLARTYRNTATVFAIKPAGQIDWGDLAGGAGYCDPAHLGHEFRAFTGLTPTRYSKSGDGSCANIPATRWTAGRCRPIDSLPERSLTTR